MDTGLSNLVDIKFSLEREISLHSELKIKMGKTHMSQDYIGRSEYISLLNQYRTNMCSFGDNYMDKQKELLIEVTKTLMHLCKHDWIEDTIEDGFTERDICYCKNCFCRNKNKNKIK